MAGITDLREIQDEVLFLFQLYRQYTFAVWRMELNVWLGGVFQFLVLHLRRDDDNKLRWVFCHFNSCMVDVRYTDQNT
ncbi:MAG: hypothetical protein LBE12_05395 [Planctomycetaceae bacterium]|nr:hypothetical protein [Planctomycetaceae bacterium]